IDPCAVQGHITQAGVALLHHGNRFRRRLSRGAGVNCCFFLLSWYQETAFAPESRLRIDRCEVRDYA
ncbi:MAG: hypothetical protein ACR2NM_01765, partial [Bythopirellula sp.]